MIKYSELGMDKRLKTSGGVLKAFIPNFVMIDFADAGKCRTIYDMNSVAATALTSAAQIAEQKSPRAFQMSPIDAGRSL
jgi:hypothetical protein